LTTVGLRLKEEPRLELRIGPKAPAPFNADAWAATAQPAGPPPAVENDVARFEVAVSGWAGKEVTIAARALSHGGRDAGWSTPVTLSLALPPEVPADLRADPDPQGVRLTWRAAATSYTIFRQAPGESAFSVAGHPDRPEWIDTNAEFGKSYAYVVQSIVKAGDSQAESDPSDEVRITPADVFPPAVPTGLTGVPSTASIELAWDRNTEPGLAGYRVFRAIGNGPFELVSDTQELPGYGDHKIESDKLYRYTVSAVKRNGLESKQSPPVEVTAP
jgi:fibronectin type 3 domain-containing protein